MKKRLETFQVLAPSVKLFFTAIAFLLVGNVSGQFTATWALTSNTSGVVAGSQSARATAGDMMPGAKFQSGGTSGNGWKSQPSNPDNWPTTPTDDYNLDFPLSPATAKDIVINNI